MNLQGLDYEHDPNAELMLLISTRINQLIKEKHLETQDIANATGISISSINSIRKGKGNPTLAIILKLARFFGKSISFFLEPSASDIDSEKVSHLKVYPNTVTDLAKSEPLYCLTVKKERYPCANFAIKIDDDTLLPMFRQGTIFVVTETSNAQDGEMVLLKNKNGYLIQRLHFIRNKPVFSSFTIKSEFETRDEYMIIGTIVGIIDGY